MMDDSFRDYEPSLKRMQGYAVCVITDDDSLHTGILTSYGSSSLVLNGERTARPAKRPRRSKAQAEISAAGHGELDPEPLYWGKLSLDPPMPLGTEKAVISLNRVRAVWPI
ncbi:hypothetical protein ACF3MZ_15580 [Paenibacillaceae bacterium WGS1546]|uniref:hypothetical protein n=1 Tax=Cohnella sp. WGS1546 TaxID=3366810 RepID=UPI00372CF620